MRARLVSILAILAPALACATPDAGTDPADTGDTTGVTDSAPTTGGSPPPEYYLPLACDVTARVGQGNDSDFSHTGDARYAFDILLARGTPVYAMAAGTVLHIYDENDPGDPCHDGGDESCFALANLVVLLHGDGTTTLYKHLDTVAVAEGAEVARGELLGGSGSTGWSTTPHLHVMRMQPCDALQCPSIPLEFADVPDGGVPITGQRVTSMNCPDAARP